MQPDLLALAHQFDQAALAQIYDTCSPGIYRFALRFLGDPQQAEDCTAETFSRFLQSLKRGAGPREHLQAYLYQIARNWITDFYRRSDRVEEPLEETLPDAAEGPASLAAGLIAWDRVQAAMAQLTPEQRQVVMMKYLHGWSNEEISTRLDKPVGAIKSLQHRALAALQRMLKWEEEQP